jgi:hypothetical protein
MSESLRQWIVTVGGLAVAATAVASLIVAVRTYREQGRRQRTQWVLDLRHRLTDTDALRRARQEIQQAVFSGHGVAIAALAKLNARRSGESSDCSEDESRFLLDHTYLLNHFEVIDRLLTNGRIDELDAYYAFVGDLELVFKLNELRDEVQRAYPGVVRLMTRFDATGERLYGQRGPKPPI